MSVLDLRAYQAAAIQGCRIEIAAGRNRVVIYGPTGSGKSLLIEAITRSALAKSKRVGIIANRIHLVRQLSERFLQGGIRHGIIQGENSHSTHCPVVICSVQTVARRGLPEVDVVIIDEGHACAGSKDYRNVIFRNSALPVIAVTATPFSKGMAKPYAELGGEPLFHSLVVSATIRDLIAEGYLVDCDIYAPSEPDLTGVKTTRNAFGELDYEEKQLAEAMDRKELVGDIVGHWLQRSRGKPTVCFASSIAHSMHIVERFGAAGVSARHIDCYMPQEEKDGLLDAFKRGEFTVLSNVALIAEGFDYPACEVCILARPTKSLIRYIQMVGRVLRPFHGKDRATVLDHAGSTHLLGYPTDDLPLELDDGSARKSSGQREEEELPKKCPSCSYMKAARQRKCPKCGFEPKLQPREVEVVEGELKLLKREKKPTKFDKQEAWSQLLAIRHERGYSEGWAANSYRKIFGVWPRGLQDACMEPSIDMRNWVKGQLIRYAKGKDKGGDRVAA